MKKALMGIALVPLAASASAHTGVEDEDVLARMNGMSAIADNMKSLGEMAKGETAFDAEKVDAVLSALGAEADRIPELFTPQVTTPKSEAKPSIWGTFEDFTAKAEDLRALTEELIGQAGALPDLGPMISEIGRTCRACHSEYRLSN